MAMAMDMDMDMDIFMEHSPDLDFSGYSTTTTTTTVEDDNACNWSDWSPVVDWDALSGSHDDFHHLFDSVLAEEDKGDDVSQGSQHGHSATDSSSAASTGAEDEDMKGLRLVHLLMAAAEALTGASASRDLARVILVRLKELVSYTHDTNMERLAASFTDALQNLMEGAGGGGGAHGKHRGAAGGPHHFREDHHHHQTADVLAAFQLLQDMSPYVKFGHFTANQAILEAVAQSRRVHIVDYDIMEGIQWASLMQALVSRKEGPPTPHLRITALSRGGGAGRRSIGTIQETGRRLAAFAASIGQPFSFHHCRLESDETFRPAAVKVVKGESLVINCMLHLPHFTYRSSESVWSFLTGAKGLNPVLVTLVEEEIGHVGDGGFVGRFMDSLHHYSALYDSLETGFPMQGRARALVERVFLGPRISGSLARIYRAREEEVGSWGERLAAEGYTRVGISFANHCQSKLLLGLFNDGYRVEELAKNRLVLGWKSRRLLSASIWTSPNLDTDL